MKFAKSILFAAAVAACNVVSFSACAKPVDKITVRLLTDPNGIDDKSFNAAAWRGIVGFYGDSVAKPANKGKLYDFVTAQTQDMQTPNLMQVSDEKYDLVIVAGFSWADALPPVAAKFPNQKYLIVDVDWVKAPNVLQAVFAEHEGSYLVGVAAALKAKADKVANPKFGFIGGVPGATITKFEMGYIQGILSVLPNAKIVDYYANDWAKPELAKTQAKSWFDSGVTTIYSAAGGTGNGAIAQAKEYRLKGKNVWAIGVDSDQFADGIYAEGKSAVLTSMIKRVESAAVYALNAVKNDSFKSQIITLDTKADGVGFSDRNPELGKDIVDAVNKAKADIIAGKIKVHATYKAALAAKAVPANLQAKDD